MPLRRYVARAALTATAATACLALAAPAWASAALQAAPGGHNPKGDNGTVKIDGAPFEDKVDNQPHVTCDFELEFFNFDEGQRADITLWSQPPSSQPKDKVVWSVKNRVISNDPASGAENDHDEVIRLSATDLDMAGLKLHEKQGYHIKLDVDLTDGRSSDAKHKVFWLQPCVSGGSPSSSPSLSTTTSPGTPTSPGVPTGGPGAPGDGDGGGGEGGGSLPLTGVAATSIVLTGLFLIGGGVALMVVRRRRDRITFTS
ncbi:LPXTG cell wall anchor domain-containing protein [Micromonospora sp. ATA32]|nr:LPXTG cell wall anchor domain-containing protein [Micromonospora sp. ATA32]